MADNRDRGAQPRMARMTRECGQIAMAEPDSDPRAAPWHLPMNQAEALKASPISPFSNDRECA
jgi:hypothetical protein